MSFLPKVRRLLRIRETRAGDQAARDAEAEIRFHLDARTEELMRDGLPRQEARARAEAEFGDREAARTRLSRRGARGERRRRLADLLDGLRWDLRFAIRRLRADRGFTLVAVSTLGLAIGANASIFSVVHEVLLRPLPYPEPDRLVIVYESEEGGNPRNRVTSGSYLDWRENARSFRELGAVGFKFEVALGDEGEPIEIPVAGMTPAAFRTLGVSARVGRTFVEEDAVPGSEGRVVLSHGLWSRRYGADPAVVGRTIRLDDVPYAVVGVMGRAFRFPDPTVEAWPILRFPPREREQREGHKWQVIGRLRPGVAPEEADAELDAIADRMRELHPRFLTGWSVNVQPYRADLTAEVRPLMWLLLAVVALVLLVACANLANLLLARTLSRRRELAVRGALGAGRGRLLRQHLTESLLLATLGGALGLLLSVGGIALLPGLAPPDIPRLEGARLDLPVTLFALGVTLASTLLFGLLPALRGAGVDPARSLSGGAGRVAGARGDARLRGALLSAQVALCVVLLVGAGLLLRSLLELQRVDYGFHPERLAVASLNLPTSRYPETPVQAAFYDRLLERVEALPGVVRAAGTSEPPVIGYQMTFGFAIQGRPAPGPDPMDESASVQAVTPGYFRTMGIRVRQGRGLEPGDRAETPLVAVVSEGLARRLWPEGDAVGRRVAVVGPEGPWHEIVGVVGDARVWSPDRPAPETIYLPWSQKPWSWLSWMALLVRTDREVPGLARLVEREVWRLDDELPVRRFATAPELYAESTARRRFAASLLAGFALAALLLGSVGVYGVLSYSVARRRREIGIRMALGAPRRAVAASVVKEGLRLVALGLAAGLVGALALTRFLRSLLFEVGATDPLTLASVPAVLLAVAALAAWIPARAAARIEPARTLREG